MKKKLLATLLCVAMTATMLAGCGSNNSGSTNDTPAAEDETPAADDKEDEAPAADDTADAGDSESSGGGTLTVWCWDPAFNMNAMYEAEKVYQQDHPDFKLNVIETPWEDVQTNLTTYATSGQLDQLPDIFLMQDNAFQKNVISYPEAFSDLTGTAIDFSQFGAAKTAYSTVDGKNYGVPFDNGAVIACYRTDLLDQAGFTVDDFTDITWDEYIEKGKKVLDATGKPLLSCVSGETDVIMMMLQSCGSSLFDDSGNPSIAGNDALKGVMETYVELVNSGVMIEVTSWDEYVGSITNESVAGTINGCWIMASIQTAEDQSGKWAITNMPKLADVSGATNYSNNGGSSWAVTSNCQDLDLAADFLAKTFAGSVEFYENILPSGALATWLPAADSSAYGQGQEFYGGDAVFEKIVEFSGKTPSNNTGVYYYEARDAVSTAIQNYRDGANLDDELQTAQETVEFNMQ